MKSISRYIDRVSPSPRRTDDSGFSLIELLVVIVILPLVMTAAAGAVIISLQNTSATSKRLADSDSAQITTAFFSRDIQGAGYIDTSATEPATASSSTPDFCPSTAPTNGASLLELYRSSPSFSVGYWLVNGGTSSAQVMRYECSVSGTGVTTQSSSTIIADVPISLASSAGNLTSAVTVSPVQFATPAANGWTAMSAFTLVQNATSLPNTATITVESTTGFANGSIILDSSNGPQTLTSCTVASTTTFTGCQGGSGVATPFSSAVTQTSVSGVQIQITEPGSSFTYSLQGSSRASSGGAFILNNPTRPTLLTLGSTGLSFGGGGASTCPDGTSANLCLTGGVVVDNGGISCGGSGGSHTYIDSSSNSIQVAGGANSCPKVTSTSATQISDPVAPTLPQPCFALANGQNLPTVTSTTYTTQTPGIYTAPLQGTLEPGVYVAEDGISDANGPLQMATDDHSIYWSQNSSSTDESLEGVLIYIPGTAGAYPSQCFQYQPTSGTPPSLGPTNSKNSPPAVPLAPLNSDQATYWFQNSALTDMVVWQDAANIGSVSLGGNDQIDTASGLMYMPSATVVGTQGTPNITAGSMIVGGVLVGGGGNGAIVLNGQ